MRAIFTMLLAAMMTLSANAQKNRTAANVDKSAFSDEALIKKFPGFTNKYATVNGIKIHYVEGGTGEPLICLPGWPQTWYSFHAIAPELSKKYKVIIVDIRGMGGSDKPKSGYDKKTMAKDIYELTKKLGYEKINLLGHDIGGMVATSFAYNYPEATKKLILMDGDHPTEGILKMPLIPAMGTFGDKMDGNYPYCWWMSFNQIKGLPEKLLEGRFQYLLDWLFHYVMIDDSKMPTFDRQLYAYVYNNPENIRTGNAWYQTFTQDAEDAKNYKELNMPVLGIGSYVAYKYLQMSLPRVAKNSSVVGIVDSGHYMNEERPQEVINAVLKFLQ